MKKIIIFTAILLGLFSCESSEDRALENFYKSQPKDPALIGAWVHQSTYLEELRKGTHFSVLGGHKFSADGTYAPIMYEINKDKTASLQIPTSTKGFLFYSKNNTIHVLKTGGFKEPATELYKFKYGIKNDTLTLKLIFNSEEYTERKLVRYKENK